MENTNINCSKRNSSFELLRIFSMLLIIMHHFYVHGNFTSLSASNEFLMTIFEFGGKFGVIIFILISGYFGVSSKFKFTKLLKLILQVWFYSMLFYIIFASIGLVDFSFETLKSSLFPTTLRTYWFAGYYVILYIFSPFINSLLNTLNQQSNKKLLLLIFTSLVMYYLTKIALHTPNVIFIFFIIYTIGAYLRLRPFKFINSKSILLMFNSLLFCLIILLRYFTKYNFFTTDSLLLISLGIFTILLFQKFNIQSNFINIVASSCFGIYLIHDNIYFSKTLWIDIFKNNTFSYSWYLIFYGLAVVLIIFVVFSLIDLARKYFLEKPLFKLIDKTYTKIKNKQNL